MTKMTPPDWAQLLARLLGQPNHNGAELTVTDDTGTENFRAPLARHYRIDDQADQPVLWLRPITGGYGAADRQPGEPERRYSLNAMRSRAIPAHHVDHHPGPPENLAFHLPDGRHARIRPAAADLRPELDAWDTWTTLILPAEIELELDQLNDDSWHGPWA